MRANPVFIIILLFVIISAQAQEARKAWADVSAPEILSILPKDDDRFRLVVSLSMELSADGADKAVVEMTDGTGTLLDSKLLGKSKKEIKTVEFVPSKSGTYSFRVTASRTGETATKKSGTEAFFFSFPLVAPDMLARNLGDGTLFIGWKPVFEAGHYSVVYKNLKTGVETSVDGLTGTETVLPNLTIGNTYGITVFSHRATERVPSATLAKLVKQDKEREWKFTWFGQSSNNALNTMEMIDGNNLKFKLSSCTFDPATKTIISKGGKFTAFHDGISFYYTEIDPSMENFSLNATFTVDYINITADGQEGFGLIAMDSLGEYGVSMKNHYTNSAAVIATKYEATVAGVKKTSKDTLGARFVTGITNEVLAQGDSGIAANGTSQSNAFSYDSSDLVKAGDVFTLTLKKTNTGYYSIIQKPNAAEDAVSEYVLYGSDKLAQLDPKKDYVGFAVARGCNVTVSDVSMVITNPKTDPPAEKEPSEPVPLEVKVDSPTTCTVTDYPFVFHANSDGLLNMTDRYGKVILKDAVIEHDRDFLKTIQIIRGINDYNITFRPDPKYKPGDKKVIARYDSELKKYVENYGPISLMHTVICMSYDLPELYVSPAGSALGKGTKSDPLDLVSAIGFAKPGQPIILAGGNYYPTRGVTIERGNDGTQAKPKTLKSAPGERAVIDLSISSNGMVVWGAWWVIDGIDVCRSQGNIKGLQIGGSNNLIQNVVAYNCGDTGIQISGTGAEPFEKWPANNRVVNCTSHDNRDPAGNNADGFAAKLTCASGNSFYGCISYSNIDDGWDLFSKIESGPIGAVLIDSCVAYKNGSLSDGSGDGDGNGFKLGGDGIAVAHVLRNCISFANGASGITSNSDPAIILERNTSFGNKGVNVNLYGKGSGQRTFKATGTLSLSGNSGDVYREMSELASPDNFFFNGANAVNSEGAVLKTDIFTSTDMAIVPSRRADGTIDMKGLLALNGKSPVGVGSTIR